jgi:polysaccharide chain length determinant protein (PEP-CTERM system associated)
VLPGKKYTADDFVHAAIRRVWLIALTLVLGTVLAGTIARWLPNKYRSETVIMLLPQRIPESYVKTTVTTTRIEERLSTLENQIMSRSRLERIILDLNLYPDLRQQVTMEEVVERMRQDVALKVEGKETFRLSYISRDAQTAQRATDSLASLFIRENLSDREHQAEDTNQFLDSQLQDARRRLIEQEKRLEEYRRRYSGELPTQATSNMQAVQSLQVQLQTLGEPTDRARERRLLLERQLADLQLPDPVPLTQFATPAEGSPGDSVTQQLELARARLKTLLLHDKPEHPDVRAMQRTIRDLETRQQAELAASGGKPADVPVTPADALKQKRRRDLKAELDVVDSELVDKQNQEKRLREQIGAYQAKLDAMPSRESDLVELTRDYTTLQTTYQDLLAKREESKLAANIERRNIGEQFKVLDPARLPERPFTPNRPLITAGGAVGGLALGALFVVLLEYRDRSFKCAEDVLRLCNLPVLAVLPEMKSVQPGRWPRKWRTAKAWTRD